MSKNAKNVAVLVVHGVGYHPPDESARAGADLLEEFCAENYTPFVEDRVRMKVERLETAHPLSHDGKHPPSQDVLFSSERLGDYNPTAEGHQQDRTYSTIRLTSQRRTGSGDTTTVRVHEMGWTDLSRVGGGGLKWLTEIYDLVFLFNTVGGQAIKSAIGMHPGKNGGWKFYGWLHMAVNMLLTRIILTMNLGLLWMGVPLLLVRLPQEHWAGALTILTMLGVLGLLVVLARKWFGRSYLLLLAIVVVSVLAGLYVRGIYVNDHVFAQVKVASLAWNPTFQEGFGPMPLAWVVGVSAWFVMTWWVVVVWGNVSESPRLHKVCTSLVCVAVFLFLAFQWGIVLKSDQPMQIHFNWLIDRTVRAAEAMYLLMMVIWVAMVAVTAAALLFAQFLLPLFCQKPDGKRGLDLAARRARWTAALSIFMPFIVLILLNLTLWAAVEKALPLVLGNGDNFPKQVLNPGSQPVKPPPGAAQPPAAQSTEDKTGEPKKPLNALQRTPHNPLFTHETEGWRLKMQNFIQATVGPAYTMDKVTNAGMAITEMVEATSSEIICMLTLLMLGVAVSVWGLARSIRAESSPASCAPGNGETAVDVSKRFGRILNDMFRILGKAGRVMCVGTLLSMCFPILCRVGRADAAGPHSAFVSLVHRVGVVASNLHDTLRAHAVPIQIALGSGVLALILGRGPMSWLLLGLRGAIDTGLDVLNWLRRAPVNSTPRARIMCRLAAVLKSLIEWRDGETRRGYDKIVILAHSQGTVIVAETLRYLTYQGQLPPQCEIALFTMGCPLRQLYALRFPYLYGWVNALPTKRPYGPKPEETGVAVWWNYYRSGDYVGRYLFWPDGHAISPFDPDQPWNSTTTAERCIGAGAHTHYWDQSAPEVALALDRLITAPPIAAPPMAAPPIAAPPVVAP